jgi:hypothetical protein
MKQRPSSKETSGSGVRFELYLTPCPHHQQATLLAVSIRQAQSDELSQEEFPSKGTAKVRKADSWKAVFCAEMCTGVAGKVDHWVIIKAQIERKLEKLKPIDRRNLPSPGKGPADERL